MSFQFSIISGEMVHKTIHGDISACIDIVRSTYLAHARGETVNPGSSFLRFPDAPSRRIISLPAFIAGDKPIAGIKWIASWPENVQRGIPRASAVLLLNDYATGFPYACMEASIISAARTAASAVLAANAIDDRGTCLGLIGNGLIARYIYEFFLGSGREFTDVVLFDLNSAEADRFAREVCVPQRHARVVVARTAEEAISASDNVVFATVAGAPWLHDASLFDHRPTVLNISLRDLSPDVILSAQNVVDDIDHVMTANTSVHLAEQTTGHRDFVVGTIADVLEHRVTIDRTRTTILSPFGMGILDVAVGRWVYDRLSKTNEARRVRDFFFELRR